MEIPLKSGIFASIPMAQKKGYPVIRKTLWIFCNWRGDSASLHL